MPTVQPKEAPSPKRSWKPLYRGVSRVGDPFMGLPIIRSIVLGGPCRGPPMYGNYHITLSKRTAVFAGTPFWASMLVVEIVTSSPMPPLKTHEKSDASGRIHVRPILERNQETLQKLLRPFPFRKEVPTTTEPTCLC